MINESFAEELGYDDPIGQRVGHSWYGDDKLGYIVGIVEDFNFNSLHYKVNTLSMVTHPGWGWSEMSIKLDRNNIQAAIKDVEEVYAQFVPDYPINYEFLDAHFDQLYKTDQQLGSVVTITAFLAIFIGCMGLFALASISIENKIKEVGIRKVLGASVTQLWVLLSRNFTILVAISFLISVPLTYWLLSRWLENFAYRIEINFILFALGGLAALLIALATISYHVIRATRSNPVKALRYE